MNFADAKEWLQDAGDSFPNKSWIPNFGDVAQPHSSAGQVAHVTAEESVAMEL